MGEADEVADFRHHHHRGNESEPPQGHYGIHHGFAPPVLAHEFHVRFEPGDTSFELVDLTDELLHDEAVGFEGEFQIAEVTLVSVGPVALACVAEPEPPEHRQQAGLGAAQVITRIHPRTAQIADGLVGFVGDVDGDEFACPQQAGEFDGILLVGLDLVACLGRDQRGRHHRAGHLQADKHAGDPHATTTGLIANVKLRKPDLVSLGDAPHHPLQHDLGGGDAAVAADFTLGAGFGEGNRSLFFMDVESDVQFGRRV